MKCDIQSTNRPKQIELNEQKDTFQFNTFYLSFFSQLGVRIAVTAYFIQGQGATVEGPIKFERRMIRKNANTLYPVDDKNKIKSDDDGETKSIIQFNPKPEPNSEAIVKAFYNKMKI